MESLLSQPKLSRPSWPLPRGSLRRPLRGWSRTAVGPNGGAPSFADCDRCVARIHACVEAGHLAGARPAAGGAGQGLAAATVDWP